MSANEPRKRTRRALLLGLLGLGGTALLVLPATRASLFALGGRVWRARRSPQQKLLAYFHYLQIPGEVADLYVSEYRAQVRDLGRLDDPGDDFYKRFLLSSDFFQHGGDESRTLSYVALYGPTITPCYNPLARLE